MSRFANSLRTTLGSKAVMAATGLLLLLFVLAHMLGNLQIYLGPDKLNGYAKTLQDLGALLWVMRLGLLTVFAIHIASAVRLTRLNRAARPVPYQVYKTSVTSPAAKTMWLSGMVVLAFVVYHLLHFTLGVVKPGAFGHIDAHGRHDVYRMVVAGFQTFPISLAYIVAQILLGLHIAHGASSMLQTLGVTQPRLIGLKRCLGPGLAALIVAGNLSIPLSILAGLVK